MGVFGVLGVHLVCWSPWVSLSELVLSWCADRGFEALSLPPLRAALLPLWAPMARLLLVSLRAHRLPPWILLSVRPFLVAVPHGGYYFKYY